SITARSQSPEAAVRRAVTELAAGIATRFWATPAPLRSPPVHDLSTALAAETVCESSSAAEAGAATNSAPSATTSPIHLPDRIPNPHAKFVSVQGVERRASWKLASGTPGCGVPL